MSQETKVKVGVAVLVVILIVTLAAVYLITQPAGEKLPGEGEKPGYVELPIQEIKNALAAREGVSTENVEVQFCKLASETDNNHFAAGAIVSGSKSIVFMFDNSTSQITVENNYTASAANELLAMDITKRQLSKWTGNKIVAGWFQGVTGGYTFMYYDGYSVRPYQHWLLGLGTVYLDNRSVAWGAHSA